MTNRSIEKKVSLFHREIPDIGLDMNESARSVAKAVFEDGKYISIRYSEGTIIFSSPFCTYLYREYQVLLGDPGRPDFSQVVQSIFISSTSAIEDEFIETLNKSSIKGSLLPFPNMFFLLLM